MPVHPEVSGKARSHRHRPVVRRQATAWTIAGMASLLLAACAATPRTPEAPDRGDRPSPAMQQIATRLPGDYISVREDDRSGQSLSIERRSGEGPDSLALSMIQQDIDGETTRRYGLRLEPAAIDNRLKGSFALLDPGGQVRRSCPMDFHLTERGLVGETDPVSCQFGEGAEAVGLLKEIAFDGRQISIGDRLVDPRSGEPRGQDRVIHFLPTAAFSGWLGVRDGEEWRIARDFRLTTGARIEPLDAAEMSLGYEIGLNYYRMERGETGTLMRLTVTELRSGEILAESWAAPGSRTIGIALPDLQVGLRMAD